MLARTFLAYFAAERSVLLGASDLLGFRCQPEETMRDSSSGLVTPRYQVGHGGTKPDRARGHLRRGRSTTKAW
jgi:hypothetical protein